MIVEETNQPLTVSDVNRFIKSILSSQKDLKNIWVKGEISNFILLSSNLETEIQADVYPKVQGIVEKILAEEGQFVNKDQVMLKLEAREYEIAEKKAQVEYNKQLSNFERLKDLHAEKLLSDEEFEQAKYT